MSPRATALLRTDTVGEEIPFPSLRISAMRRSTSVQTAVSLLPLSTPTLRYSGSSHRSDDAPSLTLHPLHRTIPSCAQDVEAPPSTVDLPGNPLPTPKGARGSPLSIHHGTAGCLGAALLYGRIRALTDPRRAPARPLYHRRIRCDRYPRRGVFSLRVLSYMLSCLPEP